MEIKLRTLDEVTVIDLSGKMVANENSDILHDQVRALLKNGSLRILISLENVSRIDSLGVGVLIKSFKSAQSAGGQFKLLKPSPFVRQLLALSGLMTIVPVFDDEPSAVASFSASAAN